VTWLRDPQAVKPQNHMPDLQLSEDEIRALVAYLESQ
jgi:cytochrome c1